MGNIAKKSDIEVLARKLFAVTATPPAGDREYPILSEHAEFDTLPVDHTEGTYDNDITQEAILKLAKCAYEHFGYKVLDE